MKKEIDYHDFATKDMPKKERQKLHIGDIWINAAKCKKCGDVIRSKNRHDFKWCSCESVAVDGGSIYAKRCFTDADCFENIIEFFDDVEKNEKSKSS